MEDTRIKARNIIQQYYTLDKRSPEQSKDGYEPKHVLLVDVLRRLHTKEDLNVNCKRVQKICDKKLCTSASKV